MDRDSAPRLFCIPAREAPLVGVIRRGPSDWGADDLYYPLRNQGRERILDYVQWADWDREGKLIVATTTWRLQIRELQDIDNEQITFERDLSSDRPHPQPAPGWAHEWQTDAR